ncbi:DoxX family protein [Pontixanthobacter sp.]|uniref:DoxX family protein n=1 Tax=Pontixanthobacter sp. TaxID=2792078 RepID=UPI003C7AFBD5
MVRTVLLWILAILYAFAGYAHLASPEFFMRIMPAWVPFALQIVYLTGVAELLGAIGLMQPWSPRLRMAAGMGLALYALCVWPANIHHMMLDWGAEGGSNLVYHIPRMMAQPVIIWLALWVSGTTDWPFRPKS